MAAGEAQYVIGWRVVQLFYDVNNGKFSCCHENTESTTLATIQWHKEVLPPPLETGESTTFKLWETGNVNGDSVKQNLIGQIILGRSSRNWKVVGVNTSRLKKRDCYAFRASCLRNLKAN
jgi:hypothetical protein